MDDTHISVTDTGDGLNSRLNAEIYRRPA